MHELGIASSIHQTCRTHLAAAGDVRLESVRVAIGELTAVEPELLRFAWEAVVQGGPDAGARLDIEWRPARQRCSSCGVDATRESGQWILNCPACGGTLSVEGGDDLDVLQLAYVEATAGSAA